MSSTISFGTRSHSHLPSMPSSFLEKLNLFQFQENRKRRMEERTTTGWDDLPTEIALIILSHTYIPREDLDEHTSTGPMLFRFVCRKWRDMLPLPYPDEGWPMAKDFLLPIITSGGNLSLVQWARGMGCPWDALTFAITA